MKLNKKELLELAENAFRDTIAAMQDYYGNKPVDWAEHFTKTLTAMVASYEEEVSKPVCLYEVTRYQNGNKTIYCNKQKCQIKHGCHACEDFIDADALY